MPKMEEKRYKSRLPEEQREADLSRKDKEKKKRTRSFRRSEGWIGTNSWNSRTAENGQKTQRATGKRKG